VRNARLSGNMDVFVGRGNAETKNPRGWRRCAAAVGMRSRGDALRRRIVHADAERRLSASGSSDTRYAFLPQRQGRPGRRPERPRRCC
jgi:hypothetical protein